MTDPGIRQGGLCSYRSGGSYEGNQENKES